MIRLERAHVEEVRGIRKLDIDFQKRTFVISGPNGSGKSGVIDAIEFGLTGRIGRLSGTGTKGLTVAEHGPHVDKAKFPDAAYVKLDVFLPALGKSATITRKVSSPKKPTITPPDKDVRDALAQVAVHPELSLTRRDVLRFILVEPTKRSDEIQALLRLDEIGIVRGALYTAENRLESAHRTAQAGEFTARESLLRHLQLPALSAPALLRAVNERRRLLGLPDIPTLTPDTAVNTGAEAAGQSTDFNKHSVLRDLRALAEMPLADLAKTEAAAIVGDLTALAADPLLQVALARHSLIEKGLALVDGPSCPLCDLPWEDERHLRDHLSAKLAASQRARTLHDTLNRNAEVLSREAQRVAGTIGTTEKAVDLDFKTYLSAWRVDLEQLKPQLFLIEGLQTLKERLASGWLQTPPDLADRLTAAIQRVEALPDQAARKDAETFLATAQLRLQDWRETRRKLQAAERARDTAHLAYETYCEVLEEELNRLYAEVQEDFSTYYRAINSEDEAAFTAKLTPSEGKLDLDVNFYDRGLYPPGAYHSEGHQDGMGVCLYLALMKRLLGEQFTFALLDDVVMSVDADHRLEFCKLLKTHFPNTQFIITTHDRLWAEQMRSAGLITAKTSLAFHSWTVDTGPLVESSAAVWDDIAASLDKGKVETAAASLRRHLEYMSRLLADQLGATPQFRADGNYELSDLLPPALARMRSLLGKAADAAQSWGQNAERDAIARRRDGLSSSAGAMYVEQWAVNKAVHYNEWANFGKKDFQPVVAAYKELLAEFGCSTCGSWFYVTPRNAPETLRCACKALNLKPKSK